MKREPNFEVMRTVAMFFIVVYHCLIRGIDEEHVFVIDNPISIFNLLFSSLMLALSSISVNLYVMVSGYFLVDLDFKMSRIVRLWVLVCFYSCIITVIMMATGIAPFNIVSLCKSLFPLSTDSYWFVTQFFGLLILSPFLAILVRQLSYKQYLGLLGGLAFMCLTIIPYFPLGWRFHVTHGNSVWSFAYLFLIAGFIKHHVNKIKKWKLLLAGILTTTCSVAFELYSGYNNGTVSLCWLDYNSWPFILSILVFLYVRQVKISDSGLWHILVRLAPYSFGVYLIHDHLLVRGWLWKYVSITSECGKWFFPFVVIGVCIIIFLSCAFIEALRKRIFTMLRIGGAIAKTDRWSLYS